jgi:hypothetical protein
MDLSSELGIGICGIARNTRSLTVARSGTVPWCWPLTDSPSTLSNSISYLRSHDALQLRRRHHGMHAVKVVSIGLRNDTPAAARSPCAQSLSFQSFYFPHRAFAFLDSLRKWRVKEEHVQRAICKVLPSISTSDFRVQLLPYLNPPHNDDDSYSACQFHQARSSPLQNKITMTSKPQNPAFDMFRKTFADEGKLLPLIFYELPNPVCPFSYMGNIPTLGCIVNLRSSVSRFLRHLYPPQSFRSFIRPHVNLSSGQQPPSVSECLRLITCCGLQSKLLSKLFGSKFCGHGCSPLASSILRRVSAKLAAATPECEAASVIAWCRQVFYSGCEFRLKKRMLEYAADAISQLALSTNARCLAVRARCSLTSC